MKATTSERMKDIMAERRLRQVDILEAAKPFCDEFHIKLNKSDISQFVSGKVEPGQAKLFVIAKALHVNEAWLMGFDVSREPKASADLPSNILPLPKMKKIPLLGTIACGEPILAEENIEGFLAMPENVGADFCLRCKGDSMINARIFDGDIVYIRQQPQVEDGEIAAVMVGDDEATLKRVRLFPDHIVLEPENPQYRAKSFWDADMSNVRILGKAVAFVSTVI